MGMHWRRDRNAYMVYVHVARKQVYLGMAKTRKEAQQLIDDWHAQFDEDFACE